MKIHYKDNVLSDHGYAVEQVPRVDHQRGHGGGQKRDPAEQQVDRDVLHGARVHGTRHQRRQPDRVAPRPQNDAEPEAEAEIARKDRQRAHQRAPRRGKAGRFHRDRILSKNSGAARQKQVLLYAFFAAAVNRLGTQKFF